jgi:hypothetical protein
MTDSDSREVRVREHLRAIVSLPGVVTLVVPALILWRAESVRPGGSLAVPWSWVLALFGSAGLLLWFALFALGNAVYMPLIEEPGLERRFGADYVRYKQNVPRWIPRLTPWDDTPQDGDS